MVKHFVQLFWGIEGSGEFVIDGVPYLVNPGQVCFFPGDEHIFTAISKQWNYRWLTMDGDFNKQAVEGFNCSNPPAKAGPCPEELFLNLKVILPEDNVWHQQRLAAFWQWQAEEADSRILHLQYLKNA